MQPQPAPAQSRKTVTVLFADLAGSTGLAEDIDPETVRTVMDQFYAVLRTTIEDHRGRVVKFTGDGTMAVFGVPDVREDDARRALEAASDLQSRFDRLAGELRVTHGVATALRIGINTGEVVVSVGDDDVVGDAVNVAARLEHDAGPGGVLVGPETWRLTRAGATFEPHMRLAVRGRSEPVDAFRLVDLSPSDPEAAPAPFVGRDGELAVLLSVFDEAVSANRGRLATILGSPGVGKTRLARALATALAGRATVVEARCDAAASATFGPVADLLRALAGLDNTSGPDEAVRGLRALLDRDPDADLVVDRAGALVGAGSPGTTEETFWAVRRVIEAAGRSAPVALVIDDVHWADARLLDLLEHLAEWVRGAPVLLVALSRPELRDLRPTFVEGGRAAKVVSLEGLDNAATERLVCDLLGAAHVHRALLGRLAASTQGNPLFLRELVRMLVDDGAIRRAGDRWEMTVDIATVDVPPTVASLLGARIERLRPDERLVLERAAVVGKEFNRGALAALLPAGVAATLDAHLESLRRNELVEPAGGYWIDEPVYQFHHVLIRDAAYRRLLKDVRAELHEKVAAWLEDRTGPVGTEHDELIGYHLELAHEYRRQLGRVDPDSPTGRRAAERLGAAAHRALERDDLTAAAALAGRALTCGKAGDGDRGEVLLVRIEALAASGDIGAARVALAELQEIALGDERLTAWARASPASSPSPLIPATCSRPRQPRGRLPPSSTPWATRKVRPRPTPLLPPRWPARAEWGNARPRSIER